MGGAALQLQDTGPAQSPYTPEDLTLPLEPRLGEFRCPHCKSPTFRRHSRPVTDHFRDILYACRNIACGCTFKATLAIEYILTPSGIPDPTVDLPFRPLQRIPGVTVVDSTGPPEPDPNQPNLFD